MTRALRSENIFQAIAHPVRRGILEKLMEGEKPASELAEPFKISLPAVSQQLNVLKEAGLISEHRVGSGVMRFPDDQLATFTCSFGASDSGNFEVIGTKGSLKIESAYEYAESMKLFLTKNERTTVKIFPKHDQFAAEIEYFCDCILKNKEIEPSGQEGLADVKIINALYKSAHKGLTLAIKPKRLKPMDTPIIVKPPMKKPREIHVNGPSD